MKQTLIRKLRIAAPIALFAAALVPSLEAQAADAMSVDDIRYCLCQEQSLTRLQQQVNQSTQARTQREQELDQLTRQIQETRTTMNPSDMSAQENLKMLLRREQSLREMLRTEVRPAQVNSVGAYNAAVSDYNSRCIGRPTYAYDQAAAKQGLQCPMTQ